MKKIIAFVLAAAPISAFAQSLQTITNINDVAARATNIGNLVIGLAISLAVLWIIVSVVRYLIAGSADEEARKKGRDSILYGVIGLFVILSIWGLVAILKNTFRTNDTIDRQQIENTTKLPFPDRVN